MGDLHFSSGDETLWAVILGAILATIGGFVSTTYEASFRRRERERGSALLFGEILSILELMIDMAKAARGRGEPYGTWTMRLLRAVRREAETYERNRESLYDLAENGAYAKIVLDFSDVWALSSLGLGILANFQHRIEARGCRLKLCGLNPNLKQLFRMTKLDQIFEIHATAAEAMQDFVRA